MTVDRTSNEGKQLLNLKGTDHIQSDFGRYELWREQYEAISKWEPGDGEPPEFHALEVQGQDSAGTGRVLPAGSSRKRTRNPRYGE